MEKPMTHHDLNSESLELHRKDKGKIEMVSKLEIDTTYDLPSYGIPAACIAIANCLMQPNSERIIQNRSNKNTAAKVAEAEKLNYSHFKIQFAI